MVKNLPAMREAWVQTLGGEHPMEEGMAWQPISAFLPGESHEQRSLVVYSPWSLKVRHDRVTKHTAHYYLLSSGCTLQLEPNMEQCTGSTWERSMSRLYIGTLLI